MTADRSTREQVDADLARADLPCGGRCAVDWSADRALVELLVGDDPDGRAHAARIWRHRWEVAARDDVWVPWSGDPPPADGRVRCGVVPLFVELQRIWTAALFEHTAMAYAWADMVDPAPPGSAAYAAQREVAEILADSDRWSSRSLRVMSYWTTLALRGSPATLTMDRHRLAGTMHVPWLNGMIRFTRRVKPRADAYVGRHRGHILPSRFIGMPS